MQHTLNLTKGNIYSLMFRLALPLFVGNILQQLYNAADAFIIGRYVGQEAFAAVGVSGTIMNLFIFVLGGCCAGISVLFSQFYGADDLASFRQESYLAIVWGGGATLVFSGAALLLLSPLLSAMQTPADVAAACVDYLSIVFCGLIATYYYNLFSSMLRSVGNTRAALGVLAISMVLNVLLDLLFVAVCGWGIKGAAAATFISQAFSAILCFWYVKRFLPDLLFTKADARYDSVLAKKSLSYGLSTALHQSSIYIGKILVQGSVNAMGTDMITAYTATTRIEAFANSLCESVSSAIAVFVAQNIGHKDHRRAKQGLFRTFACMTVMATFMACLLYLSSTVGIQLMSGVAAGPVVENGSSYMRFMAPFYLVCYTAATFVGWYRGIGMVKVPIFGSLLQYSIRVILVHFWIADFGLVSVAWATAVAWFSNLTYQTILYFFSPGMKNFHAAVRRQEEAGQPA